MLQVLTLSELAWQLNQFQRKHICCQEVSGFEGKWWRSYEQTKTQMVMFWI